jgi:hypothetical protein
VGIHLLITSLFEIRIVAEMQREDQAKAFNWQWGFPSLRSFWGSFIREGIQLPSFWCHIGAIKIKYQITII